MKTTRRDENWMSDGCLLEEGLVSQMNNLSMGTFGVDFLFFSYPLV